MPSIQSGKAQSVNYALTHSKTLRPLGVDSEERLGSTVHEPFVARTSHSRPTMLPSASTRAP